jgi:hypothetical protein
MQKRNMSPSQLRVGDRIRIIGIPGEGVPNYYLHRDTKRVFKMLIARGRSVRISEIDEYGLPWYTCRFRTRSGRWEWHYLAVCDLDNNWVKVKPRHKEV